MSQPAKFVILSQPRTGSTLVCSLLSSHPGIRTLVEPINPANHDHHMKPIPGSKCLLPEIMVQNNLPRALNLLLARKAPPDKWILSRREATHAAGFKIMAHQLQALRSEPVFWEYLAENNIKVLLVFRYNVVMQYVSDLIVQETRQPTCWVGNPETAKVLVPLNTLEKNIRRIVRQKQYLINKSKFLDHRRITYEKFKDTVKPIEVLLPWLIGEKYNLTTKLQKQNPGSLRERVYNYDALINELHRLNLNHLVID